jgi:hypothetical protein
MVFEVSAGAQVVPCVSGGFVGTVSLGAGQGMKDMPFTGTTTFEQKLADGNAIHSVTRTRQARDSAGRMMTEMAQGCARGEDGQMHGRLSVNVYDPVARISMNWQVGDDNQPKVVHVFHQPDPPPQPIKPRELSAAEREQRDKMIQAARARQAQQQKDYKTENLGVKDFNGVSAKGTRTTQTIPAGQEGNDQPLVVINENWRSQELGLTVMTISEDPRHGRTVGEYEELNRGEPDPSLFAPPQGYTVEEQPRNGIMGGVALGGVLQ